MRWLAVLLLLLVVAVLGTTELKVDAAGHAVDPPNTDRRGAQANSCRAPPRPSLPGSPGSQILWSNLATDRRELLETLTLLAHSGGGVPEGQHCQRSTEFKRGVLHYAVSPLHLWPPLILL